MRITLATILIGMLVSSCEIASVKSDETKGYFSEYWYQGKAEIATYRLKQARYGEVHEGTAVLIFVTEHFSTTDHVKIENPERNKDAVPVLKLNALRKFNTGIYPYSLMTSVFTPIDELNRDPIKLSFSGQEWCGHVYSQLKLTKDEYDYSSHSYFENEADEAATVKKALLEDGVLNQIRLNPTLLPVGDIQMIPSMLFQRLMHAPVEKSQVTASIDVRDGITHYKLDYPDLNRKVTFSFNTDFPFKIVGWEEEYYSGWGEKRQRLTTKARLIKTELTDYWNLNTVADSVWRKKIFH